MSKYQNHAENKEMMETAFNVEYAGDYSVDDFLDDVEELLDLKGKGYITCIKKLKGTEEKNKELHNYKKGYERVKKHHKAFYEMYNTEYDKNKKLTEKIDELKKEVKKYIKYHNDKSNECEKQRERADYNEKEIMELKASEQLASHVAKVNADDIVELQKENKKLTEKIEELKQENSYLTDWNIEKLNENYVPLEDYKELRAELSELKEEYAKSLIPPDVWQMTSVDLQKELDLEHTRFLEEQIKRSELEEEIDELKKRGEESLQLTMSQNEKFMDELEEKNKVIDTLKQEHRLEVVKLKNANQLYKGYACGILEQQIQDDLCEMCMGQIDIRLTNWLSKFLQEKFYEDIVPELINEITEDGMYNFGGGACVYEIEHNGKGCISITEIERSSSDDEDDDE